MLHSTKISTLHALRKVGDFTRHLWRNGLQPGSPPAFAFAVACVVVAALTRHLLGLIDPASVVFAPYIPAVLAATLIGGLPSGLIALVLGGFSAWWSFLPPTHAFLPIAQDGIISLLIYCAIAAIIMMAAESHRKTLRRYYEREHFNQLIIGELQHRLRNKMATVQAVLSRYMRNNNDPRTELLEGLAAIGRTDELIAKHDNRGVEISEIVGNEFRLYGDPSQIRLTGESLVVPPTLALSLTLIVHELLTNAVKYGALSSPAGWIGVTWTHDNDRVQMAWTEFGGPVVQYPNHKGFGSELLYRALTPFHGKVEPEFSPEGFRCNIVFVLPREYLTGHGFNRGVVTST